MIAFLIASAALFALTRCSQRTLLRSATIMFMVIAGKADSARIELELKLNRDGIQREVVLLEAADEDALRKTHRRYFEDRAELRRTSAD